MTDTIRFTLDGREVEAAPGERSGRSPSAHGIEIPHLCWLPEPGYRADGNCRACMVEVEGERVLAASCIRKPTPGMKVTTAIGPRRHARRMVMELLLADQPARADAHDDPSSALGLGRADGGRRQPLSRARQPRRPTGRTRPWRSSSTPASSATSACAPAARSRSTTSSAWPAAATASRSCSTWTTRWATAPASPAASASRPARPAR